MTPPTSILVIQAAVAVEYTSCISAERYMTPPTSVLLVQPAAAVEYTACISVEE